MIQPQSDDTRRLSAESRGYVGDALWLPNTERPPWLDGALPGDRGFDPLGLAKPAEYLQYDVDQLDQNKAVNKAGKVQGHSRMDREYQRSSQLIFRLTLHTSRLQ